VGNHDRAMEIITVALEDIYHRLGWQAKVIVEGDQVIGLVAGEKLFMDDFEEGNDDDNRPLN